MDIYTQTQTARPYQIPRDTLQESDKALLTKVTQIPISTFLPQPERQRGLLPPRQQETTLTLGDGYLIPSNLNIIVLKRTLEANSVIQALPQSNSVVDFLLERIAQIREAVPPAENVYINFECRGKRNFQMIGDNVSIIIPKEYADACNTLPHPAPPPGFEINVNREDLLSLGQTIPNEDHYPLSSFYFTLQPQFARDYALAASRTTLPNTSHPLEVGFTIDKTCSREVAEAIVRLCAKEDIRPSESKSSVIEALTTIILSIREKTPSDIYIKQIMQVGLGKTITITSLNDQLESIQNITGDLLPETHISNGEPEVNRVLPIGQIGCSLIFGLDGPQVKDYVRLTRTGLDPYQVGKQIDKERRQKADEELRQRFTVPLVFIEPTPTIAPPITVAPPQEPPAIKPPVLIKAKAPNISWSDRQFKESGWKINRTLFKTLLWSFSFLSFGILPLILWCRSK